MTQSGLFGSGELLQVSRTQQGGRDNCTSIDGPGDFRGLMFRLLLPEFDLAIRRIELQDQLRFFTRFDGNANADNRAER